MVSYGLAYGMESYGLGQRLNISTEEAAVILDAYFVAFPNVKQYMDRTVIEARERGYTETLFGRRRPIPELMNSNFRVRQAGERQAMNAGIQGLAADIFKVALVRIDESLVEQGRASRLVLQVHDEVLVEVPDDEHDEVGDARGRPDARRGRTRRAARSERVVGRHVGLGQVVDTRRHHVNRDEEHAMTETTMSRHAHSWQLPFGEVIVSAEQLEELYRAPGQLVQGKKRPGIDEGSRSFIERSPFVLIGTVGRDGGVDVSPRGGPRGFVRVIDDEYVAMPDLNGNNLIDTPPWRRRVRVGRHVASSCRARTRRSGSTAQAWVTTDAAVLDLWTDELRRPTTAIVVRADEVFVHCAKAFRRGKVWAARQLDRGRRRARGARRARRAGRDPAGRATRSAPAWRTTTRCGARLRPSEAPTRRVDDRR